MWPILQLGSWIWVWCWVSLFRKFERNTRPSVVILNTWTTFGHFFGVADTRKNWEIGIKEFANAPSRASGTSDMEGGLPSQYFRWWIYDKRAYCLLKSRLFLNYYKGYCYLPLFCRYWKKVAGHQREESLILYAKLFELAPRKLMNDPHSGLVFIYCCVASSGDHHLQVLCTNTRWQQ